MWKFAVILALLLFSATPVFAQARLTPYQQSVLNQLFITGNDDVIEGSWMIDGSIPITKLDTVPLLASSITEADPIFAGSPAHTISLSLISSWNAAVGYGDWGPSVYGLGQRVSELQGNEVRWEAAYNYYTNQIATTYYTGVATNPCIGVTNYFSIYDGRITGVSTNAP